MMNESEHIKIDILPPEYIAGSQDYSIEVSITNVSAIFLSNVQVFNTLPLGREIGRNDDVATTNLTELEDQKRKLIKELEHAVENVYIKQRFDTFSFQEKLIFAIVEIIDVYASFFTKRKVQIVPIWAETALKINEWEDVERLELDVIHSFSVNSFLPKAFLINKDKLKRVLASLKEEKDKSFSRGIVLPPGSKVSYSYYFKSPHLLKQKKEIFHLNHLINLIMKRLSIQEWQLSVFQYTHRHLLCRVVA
jgi:hypothetical protein